MVDFREIVLTEVPSENLAIAFQRVAAEYSEFPAIVSSENQVSYANLFSTVVSFAKRMQSDGVDRHSLVALNTGSMVPSLAVLLATSLLGCRFIVASNTAARNKEVAPTHFYKTAEAAGKSGVPFVTIDEAWFPQEPCELATTLDDFAGFAHPDNPWMLLPTSGTTGLPKTIVLSHRAVYRRTMAAASDFPEASTTMASLFSNTSRPFYARALSCLLQAGTIVDSYDFDFWCSAGVNLVFGSPKQVAQALVPATLARKIDRIEISGAALDDELVLGLTGKFNEIIDVYGASETSKSFANLVQVNADGAVKRTGISLDSDIEIRDEAGDLCEVGRPGEVRVRNAYLSSGYLSAPETTAKAFRDGWFYPGDVAQWDEDGQFKVIGRNDDVLSFGGLKLNAALVDLIIAVTPGVKDAVCFKNPKPDAKDEILAFVVFDDLTDRVSCIADIRANYAKELKLPCFLGNIHAIATVPRNEAGKPMRVLCQEMVLEKSSALTTVYEND